MSLDEENLMHEGIAAWLRERKPMAPARRSLPLYPDNDWQWKYDVLYRQLKPQEQFGK